MSQPSAPEELAPEADPVCVTVISNNVSGQPIEPAGMSHMHGSYEDDSLGSSDSEDDSDWDDELDEADIGPIALGEGVNYLGPHVEDWDEQEWEQAEEDIDLEEDEQEDIEEGAMTTQCYTQKWLSLTVLATSSTHLWSSRLHEVTTAQAAHGSKYVLH